MVSRSDNVRNGLWLETIWLGNVLRENCKRVDHFESYSSEFSWETKCISGVQRVHKKVPDI